MVTRHGAVELRAYPSPVILMCRLLSIHNLLDKGLAHLRINVLPLRVAGKVQASTKAVMAVGLSWYMKTFTQTQICGIIIVEQMTGGPGIPISADVIEEVHWSTCYEPMGS